MGMMARKVMTGASGQLDITSPNHPDLLVMYTMDNISGSTLVDESPNGNDGVITGATTTTGKIDNALDFGVSDKVALPSNIVNLSSDAGTVCFWVNITSQCVVTWTDESNNYELLVLQVSAAGAAYIYVRNFSGFLDQVFTSDGAVPSGEWVFLTYSSDGSSYNITINSVSQSLIVQQGENAGRWWNDVVFNVANINFNSRSPGSYGTEAAYDQLRIFNRALTQVEIDALYAEGLV